MRSTALLACASLLLTLFAFAPTAAARDIYCTDVTNPNCPGTICVDTSLDGRIQPHECGKLVCGVAGCCDPCQPPPPSAPACKEIVVGGTPVALTVGYGVAPDCAEVVLTTCRLSYYPGEPNTPVWVCTDKVLVK